jgi:hypothetical protein
VVICGVVVLQSEDIWFNAPRKGVLVFALPGERCVADISGDFKILFSDRHGDFYWESCWIVYEWAVNGSRVSETQIF